MRRPLLGVALSLLLLCSITTSAHRLPGHTVGIDLGTTNSGHIHPARRRAIRRNNRHGEPITPSAVAFSADGQHLIGMEAVEAPTDVRNIVRAAKRFIGRPFSRVKVDAAACAFEVLPSNPEEASSSSGHSGGGGGGGGGGSGGVAFRLPALADPIAPLGGERAASGRAARRRGARDRRARRERWHHRARVL